METTVLEEARALRAGGDLMAAAKILQAELEVLQKPEHVSEVGAELASLLEDELADPLGAAEAWQRVLDLIPDHQPALMALERIFLTGEMFYELVLIYERRLELEDDPDARAALHQRAAVVHEELLADPYAAIDHLLRALDLRPEDEQILGALVRLSDQEGIEDVVYARDGTPSAAPVADAPASLDDLLRALELSPEQEQLFAQLASLAEQDSGEALIQALRAAQHAQAADSVAAAPVRIPQEEPEG